MIETHIVILLFLTFFIMEFVAVREIHSIIKKQAFLSSLYSLVMWTIYFFGVYEIVAVNFYYSIPSISGAVIGTYLAVKVK